MSSILTNNGAMVALQTLKSINGNLAKTQDMISTGKSVASAKDNASVWAISKVMEADVKGFKGISDSLSLGESTVAVAFVFLTQTTRPRRSRSWRGAHLRAHNRAARQSTKRRGGCARGSRRARRPR